MNNVAINFVVSWRVKNNFLIFSTSNEASTYLKWMIKFESKTPIVIYILAFFLAQVPIFYKFLLRMKDIWPPNSSNLNIGPFSEIVTTNRQNTSLPLDLILGNAYKWRE